MARPKREGLTPRQFRAAHMLAEGMSVPAIAKEIEVSDRAVYYWQQKPEFQREYRDRLATLSRARYSKALRKVDSLLDNPNPWLALQAANSVLAHTQEAAVGADSSAGIQITINGGDGAAPAIGMPPRPEESE